MGEIFGVIVASAVASACFSLGILVATLSWTTDCEKIGSHVSGRDVYTCAKKP